MSVGEDGPSKCSRKTALTLFFAAEVFAFIFSLVALISPTWQYVNLENGRTEHHHGLWLDCKRDFSHEYGRNREFYETLNRLDVQQHPFDHFFLTPLDCVYKFDYYIDTEDLYDHNHDENRLQDDANQHLFLGWKIAALAAFGLAVLASGASLLLCICAFCHRTLICATTVLVAVATVLSSVGLIVFYIWGSYQDNNIIKEEDGIYEQYFGWAFYAQIIGTVLHFLASFLGCVATSVAFTKGKAKLVKIEVVDGDDASLLEDGSSRPFKRSFSAIYRVDSAALRHWEKEYMNKIKTETFLKQRTGSMPNIRKGERIHQRIASTAQSRSSSQTFFDMSTSNPTLTTNTFESSPEQFPPPPAVPITPKPALKSVLKQTGRPVVHSFEDSDVTYEVLPCDAAFEQKAKAQVGRKAHDEGIKLPEILSTSLNAYDQVYEPRKRSPTTENYEEPNSIRTRNSLSSFGDDLSASQAALRKALLYDGSVKSFDASRTEAKSTLINDIPEDRPRTAEPQAAFAREFLRKDECTTSTEFLQLRKGKERPEGRRSSSSSLRPEVLSRPPLPEKPVIPLRTSQPSADLAIKNFAVKRKETSDFTSLRSPASSDGVNINLFDVGSFANKSGQRSITNLAFGPNNDENVKAFERPDSSDISSLCSSYQSPKKKPYTLEQQIIAKQQSALLSAEINSKQKKRSLIGLMPDEVDRSVGSSTMVENDAMSESPYTYLKEAELRLNLFMNGVAPLRVSDKDSSTSEASSKETNVTTV